MIGNPKSLTMAANQTGPNEYFLDVFWSDRSDPDNYGRHIVCFDGIAVSRCNIGFLSNVSRLP